MKTIEERANAAWSDYEYREGELYSTCFIDGFSAGAQSERDELTCWRDPKKELPENRQLVLCKTSDKELPFVVVKYDRSGWWVYVYPGWTGIGHKIIGWRPIHENE